MSPESSGRRDELRRGHDHGAAGRMPAQQRLEAGDGAVAQLEERLVLELEFVVLERAAQRVVEGEALLRRDVHVLREELVVAAPHVLRVVHRRVGVAHQRLGVGAVGRVQADPDGGGDVEVVAVQVESAREDFQDLRGDRRGVRRRGDAGHDDHELVAADTRDRVALAHAHEDPARDRLQQAVAELVAERIVDGLEAVEVEEKHGHLRTCAMTLRDRLLDAVAQQYAVGQPGERVVMRHVRHALLGHLAVGDVHRHADHALGAPVGAAMHLRAIGHPVHRSVRPDDAVVDLEVAAVLDRVLERCGEMVAVLGMHALLQGPVVGWGALAGAAEQDIQPIGIAEPVGVRLPVPHAHLRGIHREAQLRLALPQRRLRLLAPRDVGDRHHGADHLAVVVDRGDGHGGVEERAVAAHALGLLDPDRLAVLCAYAQLFRLLGQVRRHDGGLRLEDFAFLPPEELLGRRIPHADHRVQVARDDAQRRGLDHRAQALVAVARGGLELLAQGKLVAQLARGAVGERDGLAAGARHGAEDPVEQERHRQPAHQHEQRQRPQPRVEARRAVVLDAPLAARYANGAVVMKLPAQPSRDVALVAGSEEEERVGAGGRGLALDGPHVVDAQAQVAQQRLAQHVGEHVVDAQHHVHETMQPLVGGGAPEHRQVDHHAEASAGLLRQPVATRDARLAQVASALGGPPRRLPLADVQPQHHLVAGERLDVVEHPVFVAALRRIDVETASRPRGKGTAPPAHPSPTHPGRLR
jgi:hypothetical protein